MNRGARQGYDQFIIEDPKNKNQNTLGRGDPTCESFIMVRNSNRWVQFNPRWATDW